MRPEKASTDYRASSQLLLRSRDYSPLLRCYLTFPWFLKDNSNIQYISTTKSEEKVLARNDCDGRFFKLYLLVRSNFVILEKNLEKAKAWTWANFEFRKAETLFKSNQWAWIHINHKCTTTMSTHVNDPSKTTYISKTQFKPSSSANTNNLSVIFIAMSRVVPFPSPTPQFHNLSTEIISPP